MKRLGILVVSDRAAQGAYPDLSGPAISEWAMAAGWEVAVSQVVPDEKEAIQARLKAWADELRLELILISGGTGLGPRDGTPEATLGVVDRLVPGIPEFLRMKTASRNPKAVLSRAVAGLRGRALVVNLPGNPDGVREWLEALSALLPHALEMIAGHGHTDRGHEQVRVPGGARR